MTQQKAEVGCSLISVVIVATFALYFVGWVIWGLIDALLLALGFFLVFIVIDCVLFVFWRKGQP